MSYLEAFPAKTSALQDEAPDLKESNQECGNRWRGSLAKYDPDTHSLKTAQCSLFGDLTEFCVTLPRWGTMRSGGLYPLPIAVRPISGKGYGLWPTPRSCSAMAATITPESAWNQDRFPNLETVVGRRTWPTPTAHNAKETNAPSEAMRNEPTLASRVGGHLNPTWVEWLMGWPLGWTDLKPLEMDKFQSWLRAHLGGCDE
jgi:hypothetical protein